MSADLLQKIFRTLGDPTRVASASADDLARLLTTLVRGDRFADGTLAHAHESGLLRAIARRAEVLLRAHGEAS